MKEAAGTQWYQGPAFESAITSSYGGSYSELFDCALSYIVEGPCAHPAPRPCVPTHSLARSLPPRASAPHALAQPARYSHMRSGARAPPRSRVDRTISAQLATETATGLRDRQLHQNCAKNGVQPRTVLSPIPPTLCHQD